MAGRIHLTFDNMGAAERVGRGLAAGPEPDAAEQLVGYPWLLDLLEDRGIRATFFIEGWNGEHHPDRVAALVDRGHEVGLHGWVHERWGELDDATAEGLLVRGTDALRACGARSIAFRAPGGSSTPHTRAVLRRLGYVVDASLDDGSPAGAGLVRVPFRWEAVDGYYYLVRHVDDPAAAEVLQREWTAMVEAAARDDAAVVLIAHAFLSGIEPDRRAALTAVIDHVLDHRDLHFADLPIDADPAVGAPPSPEGRSTEE